MVSNGTYYGGLYVSGDDVVILVTRKYRKATSEVKEFLNRLVTSGTYEHKNCLYIGILDMTFIDCIRFRIMFGLVGDYRVEFEPIGGVFMD